MEYVKVNGIDREASRIGLGTWAIGGWMWGGSDAESSVQTILTSFELGINLVDTAPAYGMGMAEEIVGKAITEFGARAQIVIATKAGLEWKDGDVRRNSTKERIVHEIEDSLRRLQTDYIDIYQIHWPDPLVPVEETAEAMRQLYNQGKIRAIGVSNYSIEQIELFRAAAPLDTAQPPYNLFERDIEPDVLPFCRQQSITTLVYGALCRGLLSGKMRPDTRFVGDDVRKIDPKFQPPRYPRYLRAVERLDQFARKHYGKRVIHLAVRWLLDQPGVGVALWGARRPEQLNAIDEVIGWSIDEAACSAIDRIIGETVMDPVGPQFMAPPARKNCGGLER
ncbi:MAG: aldo/keto reductase [Deltaproteobacteria bacterium]|nr:MAG: aldo/keto reductase [Deltaproteobacteria bacterium]